MIVTVTKLETVPFLITREVELEIRNKGCRTFYDPLFCGVPQLSVDLYVKGSKKRIDGYILPMDYMCKTEDEIISYILDNFDIKL